MIRCGWCRTEKFTTIPKCELSWRSAGHHFKTQTDTECILHYYEDEGDACVQRFRGMFAIALWDTRKRRLLLARDRLGKKPIYYTVQNGEFYFCSELNGLLKALPSRPEIDLEAIDLYLSLQYVPEPRTVYKGIYKLPAAHTLHLGKWAGESQPLLGLFISDQADRERIRPGGRAARTAARDRENAAHQ